MGRAIFFVMLTVAVGFLFAMVATTAVRAQVFQFGRDNPNYAAALSIAAAQEAGSDVDIEQKIILDEDFVPADFGINGVGILPTSPFYFLKGARRGVQDVFTFGAEAKTERRLQFAAEKLLEAKELAGREGVDEEAVRNALDNYRDELETVGERVDRAAGQIGDEASEDLAKKFMDSVVKYEKSLGKFEKDLSPESFEHIQDVKDRTSETFGKVFDLVEPDVVSEKLVEVLNEQKGSEFKDFKNIEVLKEVAEKVPEDVRGSIELAAENTLTKLQFELEQFAQAKKALFEDFIEQIGGNEVRHLEIINELEVRPLSDELREAILGAKEETLSRTQDRLEGFADRPEERDRFLEHLGDGNIEDIRILDELENSVSSGVLAGLVDVRREAEESLVDRFERAADDSGERDELFRSIERFHDAKSLSVLDEIGDLIPDDKQDIFSSLKERAAEEIKNDIDRARDDSQRAIIFNALAGDHPEHFDVLDRFEDEVDVIFDIGSIFDRIVEAQFDRVRERIEQIHDEERFERFESEFREREDFFRTASTDFEFFDFFDERRDIFESPERALTKIDEAQNTINELAAIADSLPFDVGFDDGRFDSEIQEVERLLELADRKLEIARVSTEYNDVGRAFGEAQAADSIAQEGIAIARAYKSGRRESDTSNVPDFLPKDLFERRDPEKRTTIVRERDEVFEDRFEVYNNFEFSEFCFFVQGFLKAPLLCVLPDGRQFDVRGQSFPIEIPYEFVPRFGPPDQGGDPNFCPIVYAPSFDFCPDGYIVEDFDERGCLLPARCERKEDYDRRVHPDGLCGGLSGYQCAPGFYCEYPPYDFDDPNAGATDYLGTCVADNYTCDAFFEGYIYDDFSRTCRPDSASGCYDPFIYHSRLECEVANDLVEKPDPGTQCESYASEGGCERNGCKWTIDFGPADAPYWTCRPPTAGGVCPNFPSVGSCPAGEQRVLSFSSPECGEYYKCITDISDEGYPYTFSTGFRVNTRYEAGNYCYAASGTTQQRILEECKDFGVYLDNTVPTNADCPSGSHPQADGGGIYYCLNDVDDYNGLCYELHSGNKIQCPSQGFGGGNCPFGYHYHSKDGGVCMNNFEDSAKG